MIARPPHVRSSRRPGFTLLEMSAVMFALAVMLMLGVGIVVAARQTNLAADVVGRRAIWRGDLADQFRADVANAAAAPDSLDDLTAGQTCLILRSPDGGHVVYRWADGTLTRFTRAEGKDTPRPLPRLPSKLAVEFDRTGGDRPVIVMRLTEPLKHGPPRRTDVSAALGGDVR